MQTQMESKCICRGKMLWSMKRYSAKSSLMIDEDKAQAPTLFLRKSVFPISVFNFPLPKHVCSSAPSSRPSGQRQKIVFAVARQVWEQFPLFTEQSPASSQRRPSRESLVCGKRSQEHSKLPQVLRQTSWHSPRPLFLEHSFISVCCLLRVLVKTTK